MIFPRHTTLIIGGSAAAGGFLAGSPAPMAEEASLTADGWDSLTATFALRVPTLSAEELAAFWPIGSQFGGRNWWVTGGKPACVAPGVWTAAIECKGFASAKPVKITWGCSADQQSAEHVSAPHGPPEGNPPEYTYYTYDKVATTESVPTFSCCYIATGLDATPPVPLPIPSDMVGREDTGTTWSAARPPVPDTIWTSLEKYVYHWPNGWVLMNLKADRLPGTGVALVTEEYKYVRPKTP